MFLLLPFIFLVQMIQIYELNNVYNHKLSRDPPHLGPMIGKSGIIGLNKKVNFERIKEMIVHKVKEKKKLWQGKGKGKGRGRNKKWKDKKPKVLQKENIFWWFDFFPTI